MVANSRLSDTHLAELAVGSSIDLAVIAERGYISVWGKEAPELLAAGFRGIQRQGPGWIAPLSSPLGSFESIYKPDHPRESRGKVVKYEYPGGRAPLLDAHPRTLTLLGEPGIRLFVTEGVKKGDALVSRGEAAISLQGVYGWRGRNASGGSTALADWECIALKGRSVFVTFDSDARTKPAVQAAQNRLARFLAAKGAVVQIIHLPSAEDGGKQGVDDFLAAEGTVDALLSHAEPYEARGSRQHVPVESSFAPLPTFPRTDAGNAELFAHRHGENVRYDHRRGRWLIWQGDCWQPDKSEQIHQLAKQTARWRYHEAESIEDLTERGREAVWASRSEGRARLEAALFLARSEESVADGGEGWDSQPFVLGVRNGVVDLRAGILRPALREDKLTKRAPVLFDPRAICPVFETFLSRVVPDAELRSYLQRRSGYALTGDVSEQDLLFLHGGGSNGKTTFVNALMDVLGLDYAQQAAPGLLLQKRGETHPTEVADLDGARLIVSSEIDDGRALAEGLVKQLTGGDRLKARRMRQDFYEFEPTFKLVLLANHKPNVRGTDWAIWRRIKLVPFDQTIANSEKDPHLRDRLRAEAPGILNWMIAGCLDWQRNGMREPRVVTEATSEYRIESDPLARFFAEECHLADHCTVQANSLYQAYKNWAELQGMGQREVMTSTAFGKRMGQRFERLKGRAANAYRGVGLLSERQESMPVEGFGSNSESEVEGYSDFSYEADLLNDRVRQSENHPQPSIPSTASHWETEVV